MVSLSDSESPSLLTNPGLIYACPGRPGREWPRRGKLGLALKLAVSCKHPMRDWQSILAGGGVTPQGPPQCTSVLSKYLTSKVVELNIFFSPQNMGLKRLSQAQGGSCVHTLWGTRFCMVSPPRLAHFLSGLPRPLSRTSALPEAPSWWRNHSLLLNPHHPS